MKNPVIYVLNNVPVDLKKGSEAKKVSFGKKFKDMSGSLELGNSEIIELDFKDFMDDPELSMEQSSAVIYSNRSLDFFIDNYKEMLFK